MGEPNVYRVSNLAWVAILTTSCCSRASCMFWQIRMMHGLMPVLFELPAFSRDPVHICFCLWSCAFVPQGAPNRMSLLRARSRAAAMLAHAQ